MKRMFLLLLIVSASPQVFAYDPVEQVTGNVNRIQYQLGIGAALFTHKDPGILHQVVANELVDPLLKKDPASVYKKASVVEAATDVNATTSVVEPLGMAETRVKFESYFASIDGYTLADDELVMADELGLHDATLIITDGVTVYFQRHAWVDGSVIRVDTNPGQKMASMTPEAASRFTPIGDEAFADGVVDAAETSKMAQWGLEEYEKGEFKGKALNVESVMNYFLRASG